MGRGLVRDGHLTAAHLAASGNGRAVDADQAGREWFVASRAQAGLQRPVLTGCEGLDVALALHHQAHGDRLHAAGGEAAADLARDERAERVAHQAIHDAPRLLSVHETHVDVSRVREGGVDGALGDLAERDPARLGIRDVHGLHDVPGDGLTFAVEVRGEVDEVRRGRRTADVPKLLAAVLADDVLGREVMLHVHAQLALAGVLRQVAHMPVRGQHLVAVAQVSLDRPRLGGRLDDHQVLGHGRRV